MFDHCAIPGLSLRLSLSLSLAQDKLQPVFLGLVPYVLRDHLASAGQGLHPEATVHFSHKSSQKPTPPQEEKLPEEPRVLHRCSTAPENSRPVGHTLGITTTRPETRALTKFSIGTASEPSLDFGDWTPIGLEWA